MRVVRDISFAGDGEPCSCPQFAQAVSKVGDIYTQFGTASCSISAFDQCDIVSQKITFKRLLRFLVGWWNGLGKTGCRELPDWFARVDGTRYPFEKVLQNILWAGKQSPIVSSRCFIVLVKRDPVNTSKKSVGDYAFENLLNKGAKSTGSGVFYSSDTIRMHKFCLLTRE